MKDFHPISHCNILYKIIFKVLANSLKPILPHCISLEQLAFVDDRAILDNVILACKILHHIRFRKTGKQGKIALKIDISKSFDIVDWNYLLFVMEKMRFHEKWIGWMKLYLQTTHYSIMVNSENLENISRTGLRQDDSLSSFSFFEHKGVLCFLKNMSLDEIFMEWKYVEVPRPSHLFYLLTIVFYFYFEGQMKRKQLSLNIILTCMR